MESHYPDQVITSLASKAFEDASFRLSEIEKSCWKVVHYYKHGFYPSEYDVREIDEELFLEVLKVAKESSKTFFK
tara:strand:- start:235 stop:459 length:225 start_codon:yes stop_codon:yes gene_type:complete